LEGIIVVLSGFGKNTVFNIPPLLGSKYEAHRRQFTEVLLIPLFSLSPFMSPVATMSMDRKFFRILASKKYLEGGVALVW